MKNKAEPLAYASTVLLLLVLTSLSISAQNFGGPLIGIPTSPIKYKYSNDRINDELFNLPMHEHVDYDLSDQHSWGSIDSDGIDEVLSYMYLGQSPKFGYQLVNDKAGN
ncbi:MAG: hypothetical protein GX879_06405, partial [Bacteroidales bacterium]|nr:hypothetical protein [Bacteroidales bacterium]